MTNENHNEEQQPSEGGFRKVDRRHSAADEASGPLEEEGTEEATEPAADVGESSEEEMLEETTEATEQAEAETVSLGELSVYDTLRFFLGLLTQQAWIHLGIQLAPGADDVKEDLAQARVAIDTLDFIVGKLQPELSAPERSELSTALANLRLNYVNKAG